MTVTSKLSKGEKINPCQYRGGVRASSRRIGTAHGAGTASGADLPHSSGAARVPRPHRPSHAPGSPRLSVSTVLIFLSKWTSAASSGHIHLIRVPWSSGCELPVKIVGLDAQGRTVPGTQTEGGPHALSGTQLTWLDSACASPALEAVLNVKRAGATDQWLRGTRFRELERVGWDG